MTVDLTSQDSGQGPPLVILHGLFGQARNWAAIAKGLQDQRRIIALDLRNHGTSPWADSMSYPEMAEDVADAIAALPDGRAEVLGHSMGGKVAMVLALKRPDLVQRLIVADIAPVDYRSGSLLPFVDAMLAVDPAEFSTRKEIDQALSGTVRDPGVRQFLLSNLTRDDGGIFRWTLNLQAIRAAMRELVGWPDVAGRYDGPTLFLAGGKSNYVQDSVEPEIRRLFPQAEVRRIAGAGHWIHAEAPQAVVAELKRFLQLD